MRLATLATIATIATGCHGPDDIEAACEYFLDDDCRQALDATIEMPDEPVERYYDALWRDITFPAVMTPDRRIFNTSLKVPESYNDIIGTTFNGYEINRGVIARFNDHFSEVNTPAQDMPKRLASMRGSIGRLNLYPYFSEVDVWSSATALIHEDMHHRDYNRMGHIDCGSIKCDATIDMPYGANIFTLMQMQAAYVTRDARLSDEEIRDVSTDLCYRLRTKVVEFREEVEGELCTEIVDEWLESIEPLRADYSLSRGLRVDL